MDYLNPKKRKQHLIRLFTGYALVSVAVILAVTILFYLVLGFSYHNGQVIQSGMMYVSSSPQGATVSLGGKPSGTTNKRFIIQAGKYRVELTKNNYRPWQRTISLVGGQVQRYDYPLLIPNRLTSSSVLQQTGQPSSTTESPNNRWLLIASSDNPLTFRLVDLNNPLQLVTTDYVLPANLLSAPPAGASQSWQLVEWSNDNQHVLLRHNYGKKYEYIVLDRANPAKSVNLDAAFGASPDDVHLFNQNYDQYWFYDQASHELSRANLSNVTVTPYLSDVLAYKPYGDNIVIYATGKDMPTGQAKILWYQDGKNNLINGKIALSQNPAAYLLDLTQFRGDWYVAVGETSQDNITIYKNPLTSLSNHPNRAVPAWWVMKIKSPSYIKFSANAQFVLAENGRQISVFNALYHVGYNYQLAELDAPQKHAVWMDGYHLLYVAGAQLHVVDFNDLNDQTLVAANAADLPFFDKNNEYLFTLLSGTSGGKKTTSLNRTPLRVTADL